MEARRIQSRARLTYEDAQSFLDSPETTHATDGVAEMVRKLGTVSGWIRSERMERGAVDLDLPESKVVMDDEGRPKDVALRPRLAAHRLIEDLMIAANEAVARFLEDKHIGGLYRIHEWSVALGWSHPDQTCRRIYTATFKNRKQFLKRVLDF